MKQIEALQYDQKWEEIKYDINSNTHKARIEFLLEIAGSDKEKLNFLKTEIKETIAPKTHNTYQSIIVEDKSCNTQIIINTIKSQRQEADKGNANDNSDQVLLNGEDITKKLSEIANKDLVNINQVFQKKPPPTSQEKQQVKTQPARKLIQQAQKIEVKNQKIQEEEEEKKTKKALIDQIKNNQNIDYETYNKLSSDKVKTIQEIMSKTQAIKAPPPNQPDIAAPKSQESQTISFTPLITTENVKKLEKQNHTKEVWLKILNKALDNSASLGDFIEDEEFCASYKSILGDLEIDNNKQKPTQAITRFIALKLLENNFDHDQTLHSIKHEINERKLTTKEKNPYKILEKDLGIKSKKELKKAIEYQLPQNIQNTLPTQLIQKLDIRKSKVEEFNTIFTPISKAALKENSPQQKQLDPSSNITKKAEEIWESLAKIGADQEGKKKWRPWKGTYTNEEFYDAIKQEENIRECKRIFKELGIIQPNDLKSDNIDTKKYRTDKYIFKYFAQKFADNSYNYQNTIKEIEKELQEEIKKKSGNEQDPKQNPKLIYQTLQNHAKKEMNKKWIQLPEPQAKNEENISLKANPEWKESIDENKDISKQFKNSQRSSLQSARKETRKSVKNIKQNLKQNTTADVESRTFKNFQSFGGRG